MLPSLAVAAVTEVHEGVVVAFLERRLCAFLSLATALESSVAGRGRGGVPLAAALSKPRPRRRRGWSRGGVADSLSLAFFFTLAGSFTMKSRTGPGGGRVAAASSAGRRPGAVVAIGPAKGAVRPRLCSRARAA